MKKARLEEDQVGRMIEKQWLDTFHEDVGKLCTSPPESCQINGTKLQKRLFKYFSVQVPTLLEIVKVGKIHKFVINDKMFDEMISQPLEAFVCGDVCKNGFVDLKVYGKPSKFCGKVLQVGDPTYNCKDCGADPTCVLCFDCFQRSAHKNHKYKMYASTGSGGYCDCGDAEAWLIEPACELHKHGLDIDESWDPFSALPDEIAQRATFMMTFLLQYCVDLICWDECDVLPSPLKISSMDTKSHIVMLFNDESHSYDEVITTLQSAIKCTDKEAVQYASVVDKEGRSAIFSHKASECQKVVAKCRECTSRNGKKPLKCEAINKDIVAHQLIALKIMEWLEKAISDSDGLRRLLCIMVSQTLIGRPESILKQVILIDSQLWKAVRIRSHQLFMNGLLMDIYGRHQFAVTFAQCYPKVMRSFIDDDHEYYVSVASLTVQIFTVPTITETLVLQENILKLCLEAFWNELSPFVSMSGYLDFQRNSKHTNLRRADYVLHDLRFLLRQNPKWCPLLREKFLDMFDVFVKILSVMQGMDCMVRKTQTHVAYEPNWESGFNLQLWITPIIKLMLKRCCSDAEVFKASMHKCIVALKQLPEKMKMKDYLNYLYIKHDVSTDPLSMHTPLSRFIGGLIPAISKFSLSLSETLQFQFCVEEQLKMLEYPLRVIVLVSQVNAKLWRRNGYAIMHQLYHYQNVRFSSEMFDRDILILQTMAAVMEPSHFLELLLIKYNLQDWRDTGRSTGESDKTTEIFTEEFFLLLFYIFNERFVIGLSETTPRDILYREVTHRLSLGPTSRSSVIKNLSAREIDDEEDFHFESSLDAVLKDVAEYREPGLSGKGLYNLKEKHFAPNQFFMHFSKVERSKMLETRKKRLKGQLDSFQYLQSLPKFLPQFEGILEILCCDKLRHLIKLVLNGSVKDPSDELIEEVLLILAVGVHEEHRPDKPGHYNFLEILTKTHHETDESIVTLLEKLNQRKTGYSDMLSWLLTLIRKSLNSDQNDACDGNVDGCRKGSDADDHERIKKLKLAERKAKMMAQMKTMQQRFMKTHANMFTDEDVDDISGKMEVGNDIDTEDSSPIAIGVIRTSADSSVYAGDCILCHQEEETADMGNFVVTCFHQNANFLQRSYVSDRHAVLPEINNSTRVNISSCGHVLHSHCWEKYNDAINHRQSLQPQRRRSCVDAKLEEYLCPLCNSLCNTVLPLFGRKEQTTCDEQHDINMVEFLTYIQRYAAEIASTVKPPEARMKKPQRSLSSTFQKLYNFIGSNNVPSPVEKFVDLFAKRLVQTSGLDESQQFSDNFLPLAWMACSFSIQAFESSFRSMDKNIFNNLADRQAIFWNALIQYLSCCSVTETPHSITEFAALVFNFFIGGDEETEQHSILDIDVFGLVISLRFIFSTIQTMFNEPNFIKLPSCLIDDGVFKLCLIAYLVKVYITAPVFNDITDDEESMIGDSCENHDVVGAWKYIMTCAGVTLDETNINGHMLKQHVVSSLLPFLRCSALFFHFLTGIKIPDPLKTETVTEELSTLLCYLNLSRDSRLILTKDFLVNEPPLQHVISRWCTHESVKKELKTKSRETCYVQPRRFIKLPHEYSELINMASGFRCPTVGDGSRSPSLCLLCGKLLCSQCYCCMTDTEVGASARHSNECANGIGIFLRIRECEVVLMFHGKKGTFMATPYLDQYGESDIGFRRGNPLYLNQKRYDQLEMLWLQQKIPDMIAQSMEANRGLLVLDWLQQ